ncbi:hypothetical protein Tco_1409438 [Tanacetum coccineum]
MHGLNASTRHGLMSLEESRIHRAQKTLRRADILVFGWAGGKHACVDLTGVSPLVGLRDNGFVAGQAALKAESSKVAKHDKACLENQHVFIPFAFDTFGFLAPEADEFLTRVQRVVQRSMLQIVPSTSLDRFQVCQIVLYILDSDAQAYDRITAPLHQLVPKFMCVRFDNDQIAKIMGYGDYQMGNITISRVYYVKGLGHILFSVGQFCDSDLEVAFSKHTCYIRDLEGVDLLKGSRGSNLYTSYKYMNG